MSVATEDPPVTEDAAKVQVVGNKIPEPRMPVFDTKRPVTKGMRDVPKPHKGQIIIYHRDGIKSEAGVPAIVTQVSQPSV